MLVIIKCCIKFLEFGAQGFTLQMKHTEMLVVFFFIIFRRSSRELQRSKTLPIIRLPSGNDDDMVLDSGNRCSDDSRWMSQSPVSSGKIPSLHSPISSGSDL